MLQKVQYSIQLDQELNLLSHNCRYVQNVVNCLCARKVESLFWLIINMWLSMIIKMCYRNVNSYASTLVGAQLI